MKRIVALASSLLLTTAGALLVTEAPAVAAPLSTARYITQGWGAAVTFNRLRITDGQNWPEAPLQLPGQTSTRSYAPTQPSLAWDWSGLDNRKPAATERSTQDFRNVSLDLPDVTFQDEYLQTAGPVTSGVGAASSDSGTRTLPAISSPTVKVGATTVTASSNWPGDTTCQPLGTAFQESTLETSGGTVDPLPAAGVPMLTFGRTKIVRRVEFVANGAQRGVKSHIEVTQAGATVFGYKITYDSGTFSADSVQTGQAAGSSVTTSPTQITLTAPDGTTQTLGEGEYARFYDVPLANGLTLDVGFVVNGVSSFNSNGRQSHVYGTPLSVDADVYDPRLPISQRQRLETRFDLPTFDDFQQVDSTIDCPAAAPTITAPANGALLNTGTPTIRGTGTAGAKISLTVDGTVRTAVATVGSDGTWSYIPPSALSSASHTISATQTVGTGAPSAASPNTTFTIDTVAPAKPVITAPAAGATVTANKPPITGTAEANSTVTVSVDGTVLGTTSASATGAWSFTPPTALSEGPHSATATAKDAAGNVSPASDARSFTVDAEAPNPPVITAPAAASSTSNRRPVISGTTQAGSTVRVSVNGTEIGTTTALGDGAWTLTPGADLSPGAKSATATATDAGGTSAASSPRAFTIVAGPSAPTIAVPANGSTINNRSPQVSGTAQPGETVRVKIDGGPEVTTTADATSGYWTATPATGLTDGPHTATAVAVDSSNNVSTPATTSFTVDATAPNAPVIASPTEGAVTNNPKPTINGTAEAGSAVTVKVDGATLGTVTADGSGRWSITPTSALPEGQRTVTATAQDAVGNTSAAATPRKFTIDTTAPDAPVITQPPAGPPTRTTRPPVSGTGEPGATVTVTIDGTSIGTASVATDGTWGPVTPPTALTDGSHTIAAVQADPAGNVSGAGTRTVVVDATAPAAPVIATPADGSVITDRTPVLSGTAEPNATMVVTLDSRAPVTVTADAIGDWRTPAVASLADGSHTVRATQTDVAGNTSPTATSAFTVDTTGPAAPVITAPTDNQVLTTDQPTFRGTGEAGATLTVLVDGQTIGTTTVPASGTWSLAANGSLGDGPHTVRATQADPAGNPSPDSNEVPFVVDTTAPDAPVITGPTAGATVQGPDVTVTGTGEPGARVTVTDQRGQTFGPVTVTPTGTWTTTVTGLPDGPASVRAAQTDPAGNASGNSAARAFVVDSTAPDAPEITTPIPGAALATTPPITGTAEPNAKVEVRVDGVLVGTPTADGTGAWRVTPATLAQGEHTATAIQVDAQGNRSAQSDAVPFVIDSTAPKAPVVTSPADGSSIGDREPTLAGTGEPGASVVVTLDATALPAVTVGGDGVWRTPVPAPLTDGAHTVSAVQTDPAKNVSPASPTTRFTVDLGAPAKPVVTEPADASTTRDRQPTLRGTGEAGAELTVRLDGRTVGSTTVGTDGTWSLPTTDVLGDGSHTVVAQQVDPAGNPSPLSDVVTFSVDAEAPLAPVVTGPAAPTSDTTPDLTGTGEPGATLVVSVDGTVVGSTTADPTGAWTLTAPKALAAGPHRVTAVQSDAAGNTSSVSAPFTVTIDTGEAAPAISAPRSGTVTKQAGQTVTGTGDPGAEVTVLVDGAAAGTAVVDTSGAWSAPVSLTEGQHTLAARQTDAARNTSPDSAGVAITVDLTASAAPAITAPANGSATGAKPPISGTAEAGAVVTVAADGDPIGTARAGADGRWSLTPKDPLENGLRVLTATATDPAGNVSPESTPDEIVVDEAAPAPPVITAPSNGDEVTGPFPVTGTAEPNSTVTVLIDGRTVGQTKAGDDGTWSLDVSGPLSKGKHRITATATDAYGNRSDPSDPVTVTVPAGVAAVVITSPVDGSTVPRKTPIDGTGEPGAVVAVIVADGDVADELDAAAASVNDGARVAGRARVTGRSLEQRLEQRLAAPPGDIRPLGGTVVDANGRWTVPENLPPGTYTALAGQVVDEDSEVQISNAVAFTIPAPDSDSGNGDGGSGNGSGSGGDLAGTGGPALGVLALGLGALTAGAVLWRRRRSAVPAPRRAASQ